jgi:CRISPR-associated endonuclease Csn1
MGGIHKILALDLGVSSVGWALVQIPENIQYPEEGTPTLFDNTSEETEKSIIEGAEILAMGVRLVPLDTDSKNNFEKGKAVELNQNRTAKRQVVNWLHFLNFAQHLQLKL